MEEPIALGRHYTGTSSKDVLLPYGRGLSIPVLLATCSKGGASEHAARVVYRELRKREGVRTRLIGAADLKTAMQENPDGLVVVGGEDAADVEIPPCPVAGTVAVSMRTPRGAPGIATSLAVLRELGLVTLFWDTGAARGRTDAAPHPLPDDAAVRGISRFLDEVIGMADTFARSSLALAGSVRPAQDAERP